MLNRVMILPHRLRFDHAVSIAALLLFSAAAWATSPAASAHSYGLKQRAAQQIPEQETPLPVFEMHSGFWSNLHHFLYLQARLTTGNSASADNGRGQTPPDESVASLLDFPAKGLTSSANRQ